MPIIDPDQYWAGFFNLSLAQFAAPGIRIVSHCGLGGYDGAWVFRRPRNVFISVPASSLERVQRGIGGAAMPSPTDVAAWGDIFGRRIAKVIGAAYHGACRSPRPISSRFDVRRVTHEDDGALLDGLKSSCSEEEWEHAGIDPASAEPMFGCVIDDKLVGIAQNEPRTADAVSPGILTLPAWRRQGIGRHVLFAAMEHARSTERLVLYQALIANDASIQLGQSLGVVPYAQNHSYRFAPSDLQS